MTRGSVRFLGEELVRHVLVAEGHDMTVLYGEGEVGRGQVLFTLGLDYIGQHTDPSTLPEEVQSEADLIVASFQLPG